MQRYWWPGYDLKLLGKLQRQQNNSQFCDTLLQTDGISIPAHACILAALSPYLSERLSTSPTFGQKRHLKLHTVKAQTLLKLVALIYSGEVEVSMGVEQSDLLSAAIKFGITDLVEGQKQAGLEERCHQSVNCRTCRGCSEGTGGVQDAQVHTEMVERRVLDSQVRVTSCASAGAVEMCSPDQEEGPSEYMPPPNVDFCVTLAAQNPNIGENSNTFCSPRNPSIFSESASDDESDLDHSLDSITNPSPPLSVNVASTSCGRDSNGRVPQVGSDEPQLPALRDTTTLVSVDQKSTAEESGRSAEHPCSAKRAEVPGEEIAKSTEGRRALTRGKDFDQIAPMVESTQISIKVKLVRTQGEVWEVANMQNTETLSVLSSLKQTALHSNSESSSLQSSPASKPETPTSQLSAANDSEPASLLLNSSTTALKLGCCHVLNQSNQPCSRESDDHRKMVLEDIMMGLNILPSGETRCRDQQQPQPSHTRKQVARPGLVSEEQQTQRDSHAAADDGGRVSQQDHRTQVCLRSMDTDQRQSSCLIPSSLQLDPAKCCPPDPFVGPHECSGLAGSFNGPPSWRTVCPELSTPDREDIRELLPPAGGNRMQSSPSVTQSAVDLHFPQCLSPLRPFASVVKLQPPFKSGVPGHHGQPLVTENLEVHQGTLAQMHTTAISPRNITSRAEGCHRGMSEIEQRGADVAAQLTCKKKLLRFPEDAYVVEVRDGVETQINLSACSVSLSHKNVLAKQREMAISSSGKSKGTQNVSTDSHQIRTRGFLRKSQEAPCQRNTKKFLVSETAVFTSDTFDYREAAPFKRKRGRPQSTKGPPEQTVTGDSGGHRLREQHGDNSITTTEEGGGKKTKRKQRRGKRVAEAAPEKRNRRAGKAEVEGICDVALISKHSFPKRALRKKQKFAQCPNSTVKRVERNEDEGTNAPERHESSGANMCMLNKEKDVAENQDFFTTAADENFNHLVNTEGNSCSFTVEEVSMRCDELLFDDPQCKVVGDEVCQLPAGTTEPLQNPREAQRLVYCSPTRQNTLQQEDKSLSDCNLSPESHSRIQSPPPPHQLPFCRPSQHDKVDVEEEVEVDILLYSPVHQPRGCKNILDNMDTPQEKTEDEMEKEEEEDMSEIDVTGDETD